ncbi:hypothetical protein K439DRAFT_1620025 [Ramaria rubella]|nr:hypothetical protein K439DRAFT_1620025 [Ramaria rubella]
MSEIKLTEKTVGIHKARNWTTWSRKCKAVLRGHSIWNLIEGNAESPPTDPLELIKWTNTNDHVVGALCQVVNDPLMQEIEKFVTEKQAWTHLKMKTHQGGRVSKLNAIHTTIRTRFTSHATFSATILKIKDHIATIYDGQEPTHKEWTIVLLLQALCDGEFEWMRKNLMSFITTSGTTLSSDNIIK